jgi:2-dehydropantoate 2-reductase
MLAHGGEEVSLIARGGHLLAIRQHGLNMETYKGNFVVHPVIATDNPAEVGLVDCVIVGVKAWQVKDAAAAMKPMIGPGTFVVPAENGVEAPYELASVLGWGHVLGGTCQMGSLLVGPGHIRSMGNQASFIFNEMNSQPSERTELLRQALERAGVTPVVAPDIQAAMWEKLMTISAMGGVGAVTRAPSNEWRKIPELRRMWTDAMGETLAVAHARGVNASETYLRERVAALDSGGGGTTSMQRDIMEGRPSELEYQNGAIVRLGVEVGVPTPVNAFIYHSLLPQELKARGKA